MRGWLLAAWAAAVVGVLVLNVLWPFPGREQEWPWVMGLMAFPVAAAVVLARRPGNPIGLLLGVVATSAGAIFVLSWYALALPDAPLSRQAEAVEMIPAVLQFGGILGLLHLFPTGRPVGRVHRRVVVALWCYIGGMAVIALVKPGPMVLTGRPNPLGIGPPWFREVVDIGTVGIAVFGALGLVALVVRWRLATATERAQLKWFYAGAAWFVVTFTVMTALPEDPADPWLNRLSGAVVVVAFWALPLAVMVAITRYRLFEIDRIISRTLAYTLVAGVVGAAYVAGVVGLQAVLPVGGSDIAVAASTLAAAALFGPVRSRAQRLVDRRFNRGARHQVAMLTDGFSALIRREVDIDAVSTGLHGVVDEALQPAFVDVWLCAGAGDSLRLLHQEVQARGGPAAG